MHSRSLPLLLIAILVFSITTVSYAQYAGQGSPVDALFVQADAANAEKDYARAAQLYDAIVAQFPNDPRAPEASNKWAYAVDAQGDQDKSIAAFAQALKEYPTSTYAPGLKRSLAMAYKAKGDLDTAIKQLRELVVQYPKSPVAPEAQISIGHLYTLKVDKKNTVEVNWGFKEQAYKAWEAVFTLFPDNFEKGAEAALYCSGIAVERAHDGRQKRQDAIDQVRALIDANKSGPKWILARCVLLVSEMALGADDDEIALEWAQAGIKNYPDCKLEVGFAHYVAGNALESQKHYDEALQHYQIIIDGNYTKADNFKDRDVNLYAMRRSCDCYKNLKQPDKEREAWQALVDKYPKDPIAALAKKRIAELDAAAK